MKTYSFVFGLAVFVVSSTSSLASQSTELETFNRWNVQGSNQVFVDHDVLNRVTSNDTSLPRSLETIRVTFQDARLRALDNKLTPLPNDSVPTKDIDLELVFEVGQTSTVGEVVVTKLRDVQGKVVDVGTGHSVTLLLSELGPAVGALIFDPSRTPQRLFFEVPFGLYNVENGKLIGQNRMSGVIDLLDPDHPFIEYINMSPFSQDLQVTTADIRQALLPTPKAGLMTVGQPERFRSTVEQFDFSQETVDGIVLTPESLHETLSEIAGATILEVRLLAREMEATPAFEMYLKLLVGEVVDLEDDSQPRLFGIAVEGFIRSLNDSFDLNVGSGDHGTVITTAAYADNEVKFVLGLSLKSEEARPAIARVEIVCDERMAGPSCQTIEISTGVDRNGQVLSPTPLSTLLAVRQ